MAFLPDCGLRFFSNSARPVAMVVAIPDAVHHFIDCGVQGLYPSVLEVTGAGGVGGVAHGAVVKSKKSSRFGCTASRPVR